MSTVSTTSRAPLQHAPAALLFWLLVSIGAIPAFSQTNVLTNPNFSANTTGWTNKFTSPCAGSFGWDAGSGKITITAIGASPVRYYQKTYQASNIVCGQLYYYEFKAKAAAARSVSFVIERSDGNYYKAVDRNIALTTAFATFNGTFTVPTTELSGTFNYSFFGGLATGTYYIDDCVLYPKYTITASASANGTITPSGSTVVSNGMNQTYTIQPNSGYTVGAVTVDGVNRGSITTYTFSNVTAAHTISATFTTVKNYTLTTIVSPPGGGQITLNPVGGTYTAGSPVTATAVDNPGFSFAGWSGASSSPFSPVTVIVDSNMTLYANFSATPMYLNSTLILVPTTLGASYRQLLKSALVFL
jgi:hypothetical protein